MQEVTMNVGKGLGTLLMEIARDKMAQGKPDDAVKTISEALIGIPRELVINIIANRAFLVSGKDGQINYVTADENPDLEDYVMIDWNWWIQTKMRELMETHKAIREKTNIMSKSMSSIHNMKLKGISIYHRYTDTVVAMINEKETIASQNRFDDLLEDIANGDASKSEKILVTCLEWYKCTKTLLSDFKKVAPTMEFLREEGIVNEMEIPFYNYHYTLIVSILKEALHAEFDHKTAQKCLDELKNEIREALANDHLAQRIEKEKVLPCNILDGYDAGWLSPEGVFYGWNGDTSGLIHLNMAEEMAKGFLHDVDPSVNPSDFDRWLEQHWWLKIHHKEAYGYFEIDKKHGSICPTDAQIKAICDYADKLYDGKICTASFGKREVSTYKLRQMDEFQLQKQFEL